MAALVNNKKYLQENADVDILKTIGWATMLLRASAIKTYETLAGPFHYNPFTHATYHLHERQFVAITLCNFDRKDIVDNRPELFDDFAAQA